MYFEGKWLQNRLRGDKNESRSLLAVDIQGHQRGGFCIRRSISSSSSLSLKYALRESGCRIGYEPTKMSQDHFWRSMPRDTNVDVSALFLLSNTPMVIWFNVLVVFPTLVLIRYLTLLEMTIEKRKSRDRKSI